MTGEDGRVTLVHATTGARIDVVKDMVEGFEAGGWSREEAPEPTKEPRKGK